MKDMTETENERMRDALQKIDDWANAYPIEVFPEPDFKRESEILKAAGSSLGAISASNMRYVLSGIKKIVDAGLGYNAKLTGAAVPRIKHLKND